LGIAEYIMSPANNTVKIQYRRLVVLGVIALIFHKQIKKFLLSAYRKLLDQFPGGIYQKGHQPKP